MEAGAEPTKKAVSGITVTLLGTGTPRPSMRRFSQSILIEARSQKLLFDFGRGATLRLAQIDVSLGAITAGFITHLHSDHTMGLPDVWLTGFASGARKTPMRIFGPRGTVDLTKGLTAAYATDIRYRQLDEGIDEVASGFDASDVEPGVVYEKDGVKVTAFNTPHDHAGVIAPNFAYRVDSDGHSVVLSSDTLYNPRLAEFAKGVDLFLHEVAEIDPSMIKARPQLKDVLAHHTTAEEAGRIFSLARPRLAAYTHLLLLKPGQWDVDPAFLLPLTRQAYGGPLVIGEDLMRFRIDRDIKVFDAQGSPMVVDGL